MTTGGNFGFLLIQCRKHFKLVIGLHLQMNLILIDRKLRGFLLFHTVNGVRKGTSFRMEDLNLSLLI